MFLENVDLVHLMSQLPKAVLMRYVQERDSSIKGRSNRDIAEKAAENLEFTEEDVSAIVEILRTIKEEKEPVTMYTFSVASNDSDEFLEELVSDLKKREATVGEDGYIQKEGYIDIDIGSGYVDFRYTFLRDNSSYDLVKLRWQEKKENISLPILIRKINEDGGYKIEVNGKRSDFQKFLSFNNKKEEEPSDNSS